MNAWADEYKDRPREVVVMGLKRLAERDLETARAEGARRAWQMHPEQGDLDCRIECYNDALIRWCVGRSLCMPDDASQPWFENQEDVIAEAFTAEGLRHVWDHLDMLAVSDCPVVHEASDEDVARLASLVADCALMKLSVRDQSAARRYLGAVLEMIEPAVTE